MGLAERRAAAAMKDGEFKAFEDQVKAICAFDVKLNFDWQSIENNKDCVSICENKKFTYYVGENLARALTNICADNMGKEALKSSLKEICIIPAAGDIEFAGGVFTLRSDLTGNGAWGADQIQEKMEKGL